MNELTSEVLRNLWIQAKAGQKAEDPQLLLLQKYMVLHGDMHEIWEKLEADPETSMVVDDHNVMLHIAMDAGTEQSIEQDNPKGIQQVYIEMRDAGIDEQVAFHVISRAMYMEFLQAATLGNEMDPMKFYVRAAEDGRQAVREKQAQG